MSYLDFFSITRSYTLYLNKFWRDNSVIDSSQNFQTHFLLCQWSFKFSESKKSRHSIHHFSISSQPSHNSVFPQCDGDAADQRLNFPNSWHRLYIQGSSHVSKSVSKSRGGGHGCLLLLFQQEIYTRSRFHITRTDCLLQLISFYFSRARECRSIVIVEVVRRLSRGYYVAAWKTFEHPQWQIIRMTLSRKSNLVPC